MARCLDPKGRDGKLLAKKIKEHIAESQSRKQKEGRKRSKICGKEKEGSDGEGVVEPQATASYEEEVEAEEKRQNKAQVDKFINELIGKALEDAKEPGGWFGTKENPQKIIEEKNNQKNNQKETKQNVDEQQWGRNRRRGRRGTPIERKTPEAPHVTPAEKAPTNTGTEGVDVASTKSPIDAKTLSLVKIRIKQFEDAHKKERERIQKIREAEEKRQNKAQVEKFINELIGEALEDAKEPGGWFETKENSKKIIKERNNQKNNQKEKSNKYRKGQKKPLKSSKKKQSRPVIGGSVDIMMHNEPGLSFEPIERTVLPVLKQELPESNPVPLPLQRLQPVAVPIPLPLPYPVFMPTQVLHDGIKGQEKQFQAESIQLLADGPENGGLTTDANFGQNRLNCMAMHHMSTPQYQPTHMKPFGQGEWGRIFQEYNRQCQISNQQSAVAEAKKRHEEVMADIAIAKRELENNKPWVGGDATALVNSLGQLSKFLEEWQQPASPKVRIEVHKDPKDPKFELEVGLLPFLCTQKNVPRAVIERYMEGFIMEQMFQFAAKPKEDQFAEVRQLAANLKEHKIDWDPREKFPELEQDAMKEKYLANMATMSETSSRIPKKQKLTKQGMDNQQPNLKNYLKKESTEYI